MLIGIGVAGLLAHVSLILALGRGSSYTWLLNDVIYNAVFLSATAACVVRAVAEPRQRPAWAFLSAGLVLSAAGDITWLALAKGPGGVPTPSVADALYILAYPCLYAGIGLLVRERLQLTPSAWIDGAIGGLAAGALAAAALGPALIGLLNGDAASAIVNMAYPVADVLLVGFVVMCLVIGGDPRTDRRLAVVGLGLTAWALADGIFLYQEATSGYDGGPVDSLWLIGAILVGAAAVLPAPPASEPRDHRSILVPAVCALTAIGILAWDHFDRLPEIAMWLSAATLGAVILRLWLSFRENEALLETVRTESVTDALTGLPNRRALLAELEEELRQPLGRPALFAIFDLDGFKAYNDAFGHPAGDALLRRLGQGLASAVGGEGRAYRLGGDEFCILVRGERHRFRHVLAAGTDALTEGGEGFMISTSRGVVTLHEEVTDASEALRVADARMYEEKDSRPSTAARQTSEVLIRILHEREPDLSQHMKGVAALATGVGRRLDMTAEELDVLARAAELHDVGKVGIPDRILHKPGPLDENEWELIRAHTLIGERILAGAPAMAPVALVVRSSHERWDGTGYPDGLVGEEIPLAARIVAVCDAYDAMVSERPYGAALTREDAVAELHRCGGTQFDSRIIDIFSEEVYKAVHLSVPGVGGKAPVG